MKLYVASSWRNSWHSSIILVLRENPELTVYDYRNPAPGDSGFSWGEIDPNWQSWTPEQYRKALKHPAAQRGYGHDINALRDCEACLLIAPSGRSASWELGYAQGAGKRTAVFIPEACEPELMYSECNLLVSFDEVRAWAAGGTIVTSPTSPATHSP